jgi:ribose-phosphate pyrophosphokinase
VNAVVLALPEHELLARRVSECAGIPFGSVESRKFPDGETYLRIDADCAGRSVVLVCTLDRPDRKILPLVFLADAARAIGATRVGLVAPYLAYMRQDRRFHSGEALTSGTFAQLLSRYIDWLVTIDPHLHRYRSLADIYSMPTRVIHAAPEVSSWIAAHIEKPLIVGPDDESLQWVKDIADRAQAPYIVMRKTRYDDERVEVRAPDVQSFQTHTPVVVDDIVSSARTMIETVKCLIAANLRAPICVGVHALFSETAEQALREAGARQIVTTSSVPHLTNRIDIVPLLAPAVREFV